MRTPITKPGFDNIPTLVDMSGVDMNIINSAAEEEVYRVTIPRSSLGRTDRIIKFEMEYAVVNVSGGARTVTYRTYYGDSVALVSPVRTYASIGGFTYYGNLRVFLINDGTADDQRMRVWDVGYKYGNSSTLTQDSTKKLELVVTMQFSDALPSLAWYRLVAITTQMAP